MTVDADGFRRYKNSGTRYKPVAPEDRKYGVRRPDDPRAVRFHTEWFLPLDLLPDEQRVMPETIPDEASKGHRLKCKCYPCRRPGGRAWLHQQRVAAARATASWSDPPPDRP